MHSCALVYTLFVTATATNTKVFNFFQRRRNITISHDCSCILSVTQNLNRSVCLNYLISFMIVIQSHNHTPDSALALIRSERAYIHPNQSYIEQLEVYHEFGCDASSAAQKWTQRQAELADTKRKTRMNPVFFFAHARLRLLNWIHRKVR